MDYARIRENPPPDGNAISVVQFALLPEFELSETSGTGSSRHYADSIDLDLRTPREEVILARILIAHPHQNSIIRKGDAHSSSGGDPEDRLG